MIEKKDVDNAVINFCKEVIKEPLLHFSESDLHVLLIEKLYEKIPLLKKKKYDTDVKRGKTSKTYYKTRLVHREYGGGEKTRIDIIIFDEQDVKKINNPNLQRNNDYLEPCYAFELGTEKIGEKVTAGHVESDLNKLTKKTKECGYLIHIFRDNTRSALNKKRSENTEQKLEKFKSIFSGEKIINQKKVKVIAILLRPFKKEQKTWGKCMIFDKNDLKWKFIGVENDSRIEKILSDQLK